MNARDALIAIANHPNPHAIGVGKRWQEQIQQIIPQFDAMQKVCDAAEATYQNRDYPVFDKLEDALNELNAINQKDK